MAKRLSKTSLLKYSKVIHKYNKVLTTPNKVIPSSKFAKMFNIKVPNENATFKEKMKFNYAKLTEYTNLNLLLTQYGYCIKQNNYGSEYIVLGNREIKAKAKRYKKHASNTLDRAKKVEFGVINRFSNIPVELVEQTSKHKVPLTKSIIINTVSLGIEGI